MTRFATRTSAASTAAGVRRRPTTSSAAPSSSRTSTAGRSLDQQPDGTLIGPGATAPGGWLRVAKEGGPHLLWSAEYTGAGRMLQYNDVGYMARQNLHVLKASLGWRTLRAGRVHGREDRALEVTREPQPVGPGPRPALRAERAREAAQLRVDASSPRIAPARFDDREVGNGVALERARYLGGRLELATDPRGLVYATLANQTQLIGGGELRHQHAGERCSSTRSRAARHRAAAAGHVVGGRIPLRAADRSTAADLLLRQAERQQRQRDAARVSYTFTPQLTLQAYAQAFLASGHFDDMRRSCEHGGADGVVASRSAHAPSIRADDRRPSDARLRGRGAERQRRVPLGVPARVDDLLRLLALADPDRPASVHAPGVRSTATPSATAARRTSSC